MSVLQSEPRGRRSLVLPRARDVHVNLQNQVGGAHVVLAAVFEEGDLEEQGQGEVTSECQHVTCGLKDRQADRKDRRID